MINPKEINEFNTELSLKQTQQTHNTGNCKVNIKQLPIECKPEQKILGPSISDCALQSGQDDNAIISLASTIGSSGNLDASVEPISTASFWRHDDIADCPWKTNSTSW